MPFNLRGGSPKSMKQGIYWVQRHQADQRRRSRGSRRSANPQPTSLGLEVSGNLTERYERILSHVKIMIDGLEVGFSNEKEADKFRSAADKYQEIRKECDAEGLSAGRLNRLQTAAKNLIVMTLSDVDVEISWLAKERLLIIDGNKLDFS